MPMVRCSALVLATLVGLTFVGGCGSGNGSNVGDGAVDDGGNARLDGGLPPGASCVIDVDAGDMIATSCRDNPLLPTCFQCVDLTSDGVVNGICAYTCRMGEQDCPTGQTCTLANVSHRTSFQDCRNLTDGYELGYCE